MRRILMAVPLGVLTLLMLAMPAGAGVTWCRADPIVRLNGAEVQIWVAVPEQYTALVNGPIDVKITTSRDVRREVVFLDQGFNGHGETVTFLDKAGSVSGSGAINAKFEVTVPIRASAMTPASVIPVQVEVIQNGVSQWFIGSAAGVWFNTTVQGVQ